MQKNNNVISSFVGGSVAEWKRLIFYFTLCL